MNEAPRVTDLVPTRWWALALWFLAFVAVVAGLEALYAWMPQIATKTTDGRVAAFDLDGEGSLGAWYSSITLVLASAAALVVYAVRRRRVDDYHARYRIWLWTALVWLVMSIDEAASLHEGFKELLVFATGRRLLGDGSLWWAIMYALILGPLGIKLVLDMRGCTGAIAALLAAGVSYAVAVAAQLGWLLPESGARGVMLEEGAEMLGNVLVLFSMVLYARHVIGPRQATSKRPAKTSSSDAKHSTLNAKHATALAEKSLVTPSGQRPDLRIDRPTLTSKPLAGGGLVDKKSYDERRGASSPRSTHPASPQYDEEDEGFGGNRKLSKAERKALRRLKQRDRDSGEI